MESELKIKSPIENPTISDIDILLIGGVHGDEPSGVYAIKTLQESIDESDLKKTVGFVLANPRAIQREVRYTESDLNRLFGRDSEPSYEQQRSKEISTLVDSADSVLSLHATQSDDEPFGLVNYDMIHHIKRSLFKLSLSKAVIFTEDQYRGSLIKYDHVLEIEVGYQGSQSAKNNALRLCKEFLSSQYAFQSENQLMDLQWSDCMLYKTVGKIAKQGETDLYVKNFDDIPPETVYASSNQKQYISRERFVPILMSEEGYESILGYRGKKLRWLSEYT
jgi:succinylglutamate desuccinylase